MTLYTKKKVFGVLYMVVAYLTVLLIVGNVMANQFASIISQTLGQATTKVVYGDGSEDYDADYYPLEYENYNELRAEEEQFGKDVSAEGVVLLQNASLPLDNSTGLINATLLGFNSVDSRLAGGGNSSGMAVSEAAPPIRETFAGAGIEINSTVYDFYNAQTEEVSPAAFTDEVTASIAEYHDVGIIFIKRGAAESIDLAKEELQLSDTEKELVDYSLAHFSNTIVLLNTANPISCQYFEGKDVNVLWIGLAGDTGLAMIPKILLGEINPSGHTVDTFAYDQTSSPAMLNSGDFTLTNVSEEAVANKYLNYAENIYVGYRYYETRYADVVMKQGNPGDYDYAQTVQYPFGYGLSYTTFDFSDFVMKDNGESFTLSVDVTNVGNVSGKEAVGFYMQSPYTEYDKENGVEKSAIQLVAFGKTSELAAGASETVTVEVPKRVLRAYDAHGAKTYIVDEGDYYFTAGPDVHTSLNNILAALGYTTADGMTADGDAALTAVYAQEQFDAETYSYGANGEKIINAFEKADLRHYDEQTIYLSRNDWEGTYPEQAADREATEEMISDFHPEIEEKDAKMPVTGADNGLKLLDLKGVAYDDAQWETLLDQMTPQEMMDLVAIGGYQTLNVASVSKPMSTDQDGTASVNGTMMGGFSMFVYPSAYLTATTWNSELASRQGYYIAQDGLMTGITGWYAPGADMHRTPNGGKTSEYWSEDPVLTGEMVGGIVKQATEHGMVTYIKHFFLNDQETNRTTVNTFSTEQAIREIYLAPFEDAIVDGGSNGVMTAMNRVGTLYASANPGLLNNVLREEWGFAGVVITDAALSTSEKIIAREVLLSGTDLFLCTNTGVFRIEDFEKDARVMQALRQASHRILYTYVNSNVMNGLTPDTEIIEITPAWVTWMYTADAIIAVVLILASVVMGVSLSKAVKKERQSKGGMQS